MSGQVAYLAKGANLLIYASCAATLVEHAPEFRDCILKSIPTVEAHRPVWMAVVPSRAGSGGDGLVLVSNVFLNDAPDWWTDRALATQE